MAKRYKVTYYHTYNRAEGKTICSCFDKKEAIDNAYDYIEDNGYASSCDTYEDVALALDKRGFYMLAYGPRELDLEEVG